MRDLISRLERLTQPDREVDGMIALATRPSEYLDVRKHLSERDSPESFRTFASVFNVPKFTSSIDEAMTLVPEGYDYGVSYSKQHGLETWVQKPFKSGDCHQGYAPEGTDGDATRAIALCIAALYARSE